MFTRVIIALVALVVAFAILGADTGPAIKTVPPVATSLASGQEMFTSYCAVCHGPDAKGAGPAAAALKVPPADLTRLASKNGGTFPELRVSGLILGDGDGPTAHGSKEMPVWGNPLRLMSYDSGSGVQLRVANLTAYIKTLQAR
jgi:mono/diheme cytochrome c family protein